MKSLWQEDVRQELKDRLARLTPETPRLWGRMTASQMTAHVANTLRSATGDLPVASKKLPLRFTPLKQLMIYWLPIPKNVPTAPELISRPPKALTEEQADVCALIDQFERLSRSKVWPDHAAFGSMSGRDWAVLMYRHTDHHLRQFGV